MTEEETVTRPLEDGNMLDQMQKAKRQSESFQKPSLQCWFSNTLKSRPVEFYFADANLPYDKQVYIIGF